MLKHEIIDGGYMINNTLYRGEGSSPDAAVLSLAMERGDDVVYVRDRDTHIEYPGEYDVAGYAIQSWMDKNQKLNYIVMIDGKKVALVQSVEGLDDDAVTDMATWLVTNQKVANAIDKRELGGTVVVME